MGIGMAQDWLENLPAQEFLQTLKKRGAGFLEFNISERQWPRQRPWMEEAFREGLSVSFHAPYREEYDLLNFEENLWAVRRAYEALFDEAAAFCREKGYRGRVNLHGAAGGRKSKEELLDRTVSFLQWLEETGERRRWPLEYVIEILPANKNREKTGTAPEDLLEVKRRTGNILEGFCWDLGHHLWNEYGNVSAPLPEQFLQQVRHVHIHDFIKFQNYRDHYPLDYGVVPWRQYLRQVWNNPLRMVLEINFQKAAEGGNPLSRLLASLDQLGDFVRRS